MHPPNIKWNALNPCQSDHVPRFHFHKILTYTQVQIQYSSKKQEHFEMSRRDSKIGFALGYKCLSMLIAYNNQGSYRLLKINFPV